MLLVLELPKKMVGIQNKLILFGPNDLKETTPTVSKGMAYHDPVPAPLIVAICCPGKLSTTTKRVVYE